MVPGTQYHELVPATLDQQRYLLPHAWYQALGTRHLHRGYLVHLAPATKYLLVGRHLAPDTPWYSKELLLKSFGICPHKAKLNLPGCRVHFGLNLDRRETLQFRNSGQILYVRPLLGPMYLVPGIWYQVNVYQLPGTWYHVPGISARYLLPNTRYLVLGTW